MAKVSVQGVSKVYPGGVRAVKDVDLEIADKEFLVLVGPSGCGKSTFLRMIAGLETISEGKIYIGEVLVNDLEPKDRDIAMVFQNYALYPHMTVRRNLDFGLRLRHYPKDEIETRVKKAAEILGLTEYLDRKPGQLSGGQRQRVAVGRAIVRQPQVFLFDEPLSNLDAKLRVQMRTEISKLHQKLQATIIYVTHDQVEAMTMGTRIVVLKDGEIQQVDNPIKLYRHPQNRFVAGFIGSPPMNFMEGIIKREGEKLYFEEGDNRLRVIPEQVEELSGFTGKKIIFGVRPEDIYLQKYSGVRYPESELTAKVEVVEPMGSELYLYLNSGRHDFIARIPPREEIGVGKEIRLVFDMSKVHFFDPDSGKTLV